MRTSDRSRTAAAAFDSSYARRRGPDMSRGPRSPEDPVRIPITASALLEDRLVRDAVRGRDVDRVGPREHPLGPLLLRVEDGHEVGVVLRLGCDDRVPGLELSLEHGLRRLLDVDALRQQLLV